MWEYVEGLKGVGKLCKYIIIYKNNRDDKTTEMLPMYH